MKALLFLFAASFLLLQSCSSSFYSSNASRRWSESKSVFVKENKERTILTAQNEIQSDKQSENVISTPNTTLNLSPTIDQQSTVNSQQSTVNSQHSTVNGQQSTVNSQWSKKSQQSTVNSQRSIVNSQPSIVNGPKKVNSQQSTVNSQQSKITSENSNIDDEAKEQAAWAENQGRKSRNWAIAGGLFLLIPPIAFIGLIFLGIAYRKSTLALDSLYITESGYRWARFGRTVSLVVFSIIGLFLLIMLVILLEELGIINIF